MPGSVKVGGAWKTVSAASVKVGGTWKTVSAAYTKIGGTWKQWYTSAVAWMLRTFPTAAFTPSITYVNGKWYALQFTGTTLQPNYNTYKYSTDGINWTAGTLPSSAFWTLFTSVGNRLIAINSLSAGDGFAYSDNGTTWTLGGDDFGGGLARASLWDGTRLLVVTTSGGNSGLVWTTDGATIGGSIDIQDGAHDIAFDGSSTYIVAKAITAASVSNLAKCTSNPTVSTNWTTMSSGLSRIFTTIMYGNSIWVAMPQENTGYVTSTNGTTWTARTLPAVMSGDTSSSPFWNKAAKAKFINGYFYYYYKQSSTVRFYRSSDGINWTNIAPENGITIAALNTTVGWATNGDKVIAAGAGSSGGTSEATLYYLTAGL